MCVVFILISQLKSFTFVEAFKCLVYSYNPGKIQTNELSINAGQVLDILLK